MIDRVKSNAKLPYFQRVILLEALLGFLYVLPVFCSELSIIVGQECWALELSQGWIDERTLTVGSGVQEEVNLACASIICILN